MSDDRGTMPHGKVDEEALDWAMRMNDPAADWDAFMAWLEGDATRADRYDRMVAALHDAADAVAAVPQGAGAATGEDIAPPAEAPAHRDHGMRRHRAWIGGAIAAALIGAVGIGVWRELPQPYVIATRPGEQRTIALADGSSLVMAGGSSVQMDHHDDRVATVERGQILFRVRHDPARPFDVRAGTLALTDLGTVFDVSILGQRTRVAVAEGAVMVDPAGAALRLAPGEAVLSDGSTLRRQATDPGDVGAWRQGRLAFDDATLAEVAEDLSRQLGMRIAASAAIAPRTFHGTIELRGLKENPALLGALLGVRVRQDDSGWTLEAQR